MRRLAALVLCALAVPTAAAGADRSWADPGDVISQGANRARSKPAQVDHAGIYLGGGWFIHSSGNGTMLQPFEGWYRDRFAWARRPLRQAGLS